MHLYFKTVKGTQRSYIVRYVVIQYYTTMLEHVPEQTLSTPLLLPHVLCLCPGPQDLFVRRLNDEPTEGIELEGPY